MKIMNPSNQRSMRRRQPKSDGVRLAVLEAAGVEFSEYGFEGASTRRIAERAGIFQAQIGYHVGNKDQLWKATLDHLFAKLREHLESGVIGDPDRRLADPVEVFADVIRRYVRHTADCPELPRIMLMESAKRSDRSDWLVKEHVRPTLRALGLLWADVRANDRGRNVPVEDVFMMLIGLAPMPFAQAGILRPLLGAQRCRPERHAESMIEWILG
jgi:AcrR family transcriptional regulator